MNTNEKGNIGLAKVISDLVEKGYFVFTPFADTTSVDLVASDSFMNLKKIQIKYRKINKDGVIEIHTSSVVNSKRVKINLDKIDIWAIYCPDNKVVYYLPTELLKNKTGLYLRVSEPKQKHKTMNFAKDYVLIENAWK